MTDEHTRTPTAIVGAVGPDDRRMHPMVARMLELRPSPEDLRGLLGIQREWEAGESLKAYTQALIGLRPDLPVVVDRDQLVKYGTTEYRHSSLAAVMMAVVAPLAGHGFVLTWRPATPDPRTVTVSCVLTHRDGHSETTTISAAPDPSGNKSPPQAVASTITLLERYTALALLGIATADPREPTSERPEESDAIDTARNLRALATIRDRGRTITDAEELVGRPPLEWTSADLDVVRDWLRAETEPAREPGEEG